MAPNLPRHVSATSMGIFSNRHILAIHILQVILIHVVMGLSGARIFLKGSGPTTRAYTIGLSMAGKSMVVIIYIMMTQHTRKFRKWASLKANFILNTLEIVFWAAVAFLTIQANVQRCVGISCTLGWVIAATSIVISIIDGYVAMVSWTDWRFFKKNGVTRGQSVDRKSPIVQGPMIQEESRVEPKSSHHTYTENV